MRRNRAPGAGNARELAVMKVLAEEGWLCASRRHIGGAGDVLAVCIENTVEITEAMGRYDLHGVMLIEVKSTARVPWQASGFGPADRQAMVETAAKYGAEAWLYWWPPRGQLQRIPANDWPISRTKAQGVIEVISE